MMTTSWLSATGVLLGRRSWWADPARAAPERIHGTHAGRHATAEVSAGAANRRRIAATARSVQQCGCMTASNGASSSTPRAEDVWPLLAEPDGWARWLADEADVDVRPGGRGRWSRTARSGRWRSTTSSRPPGRVPLVARGRRGRREPRRAGAGARRAGSGHSTVVVTETRARRPAPCGHTSLFPRRPPAELGCGWPPRPPLSSAVYAWRDPGGDARRRLRRARRSDPAKAADHAPAAGPASATELAGPLPMSRQAVVKHLQVLEQARLARPARQGREVRWSAQPAPLVDAAEWLVAAGSAWDRRLARLARALGANRTVAPSRRPARSGGPAPGR